MALKSKRPSAGPSRGGQNEALASKAQLKDAGAIAATKSSTRRSAPVETIEARLERKAAAADTKTFAIQSLGQMSRERRHKLLYGD